MPGLVSVIPVREVALANVWSFAGFSVEGFRVYKSGMFGQLGEAHCWSERRCFDPCFGAELEDGFGREGDCSPNWVGRRVRECR